MGTLLNVFLSVVGLLGGCFFVCLVPTIIEYVMRKRFPAPKKSGIVLVASTTGSGRHIAKAIADLRVDAGKPWAEDNKRFTVYCVAKKEFDAQKLYDDSKGRLNAIVIDLRKMDQLKAATKALAQTGLPLVGLINNAQVGGTCGGTVEFQSMEDVTWFLEKNYLYAVRLTKALIPAIRKSKGRIVNITSLAGALPAQPGNHAYAAAQHALEVFSDSLRREMSYFKVSVSVIETGAVALDMARDAPNFLEKNNQEIKVYTHHKSAEVEGRFQRMQELASSPTDISVALTHALISPFPHTRYAVANVMGIPAWLVRKVAIILPDRLADVMYTTGL